MENYDVIIIGAGLGGLTAGALLSKQKRRVLLLEQHSIVGGCATNFKRKDLTIEVGLHEMDGMDDLSGIDKKPALFRYLGIDKKIRIIRVPEFYRVVRSKDLDITVPDRIDDARRILCDAYPSEKRGIKRYFEMITGIRRDMMNVPIQPWKLAIRLPIFPFLYPHLIRSTGLTLGKFLNKNIQNEDLKLILAANLGYYHDDPDTMAMNYYSSAQGGYYQGGGHFIYGGSGQLSDALADVIRENGGTIQTGRLVDRILMDGGRAVGVSHTRKDGTDRKINHAPIIIANTAIPHQVEGMLSHTSVAKKFSKSINGLKVAPSLISVYLGFEGNVQPDNQSAYSTIILPPDLRRLSEWATFSRGVIDRRGFVFVDYSKIDSGLAPSGKSVGVICTMDYMHDWALHNTSDYRKQKERAQQLLLDRLEDFIPGMREKLIYSETATARTIHRYIKSPEGTAYGFAQITGQSVINRPGPGSPLPGLYYAGSWSMPGGGFTGAMLSGLFAAQRIDSSIHLDR